MKITTRKSRAAVIQAERYVPRPGYGPPCQFEKHWRAKRALLDALGAGPDPDAVDEVLESVSDSTWIRCESCHRMADRAVVFDFVGDEGTESIAVCAVCIYEAAALLGETP